MLRLLIAAGPLLQALAAPAPADEVALLQSRLTQQPEGVVQADTARLEAPEHRLAEAMDMARKREMPRDVNASMLPFEQPMINFGDAQYISYMSMGKFMITGIIDTGSFELVVFGSDCQTCGVAAHYSRHLSETFVAGTLSTQHNYGSGGALCNEGWEEVSIGPFPPAKQMFWEVVDAQMPVLQNAAFESIIGVGPTEAALVRVWDDVDFYVKNLTSYYDQAMVAPEQAVRDAQEMVKIGIQLGNELPMLHTYGVKIFSICMGSAPGSDGLIMWNDNRPSKFEELFVKVPVLGHLHTWSASLTAPGLRSSDGTVTEMGGCANGCEALIDSGTSLLAAPTEVVDSITRAMDDLDANCTNLHVLPDLTFQLGGHSFSLPPSAYVAKLEGEPNSYVRKALKVKKAKAKRTVQCELVVIDTGSNFGESSLWILGVPWFRKYYTTFQMGAEMEERSFYIAEHGEDACEPRRSAMPVEEAMAARVQERPRGIQADRLHLPHPRRMHNTIYHRQ